MKQRERCSGRRFDSAHLHRSILDSDVAARSRDNFKDSLVNCIPVCFVGDALVSTGQRVTEWTARQAIDVNEAKSINANDEVFALAA